MNRNLKQELKEHYYSKNLKPYQLNKLQKKHSRYNFNWARPAACGFVLVVFAAFLILKNQQIPVEQKIAKEVSYNHKKNKPPEVLTNNYNELNHALDRLDFKSIPSKLLGSDFKLIGGRYCSIQGKIAAQLKLLNTVNNEKYILYQFKASGILMKDAKSISILDNKVLINIWSEGDLGFALAKDM